MSVRIQSRMSAKYIGLRSINSSGMAPPEAVAPA